MMFPDTHILERRLRQLERLPWAIPASVIIEMSDEDLDELDAASEAGEVQYWRTLNRIVARIRDSEQGAA